MSNSGRRFLTTRSAGLLAAAAPRGEAQPASNLPPGAPPAFGTGPEVGPEVSASTFAEAEKLMQVQLTEAERDMAAHSWRRTMASLYERRTGPRKPALESTLAPATRWDPVLPGIKVPAKQDRFVRSHTDAGPLPSRDEDIAFASVTQLSQWIEHRKLTSERLTNIYLDRLQKFDPKLHCVITLTHDLALKQARQADAEIAAGHYRGPLHGIPWEAKISSTPPAFPPPTAPNRSATVFPPTMPWSCKAF